MNQILVNEHEPNKNQKNAQIDNTELSISQPDLDNNELNNNQLIFNNAQMPDTMQSSLDNVEQPYDAFANFESMQQPYNMQPMDNSIQTSYTEQVNNDLNQSYNSVQTYDTNDSFNNQPQYDVNQNYETQSNYTNSNYESKTIQKVEIKKVIRIFCVVIIVFGLVLGGKALFTFIKAKNSKKDTPVVNIDKMGREATISISTQKPIKEYSYQWNKDGEPEIEQGNGRVSIEKTIQIPNGNNILNIVVTDYYGNKTKYFKQYIYESTDITKPTINLSTVGNKLKIIAEDDTEMLYITYSWNDEEEIRIDVSQDDKKTIEKDIEVPVGQNKLTITAVDKEENKEKRTENIVGDNKPTFDIQTDGENIVVIAKDDEGISKISITVDDVTTDSGDTPINQTEVTAKLPISRGTHTITVTVTNINGLSETKTVTHTF